MTVSGTLPTGPVFGGTVSRSEEHTSELQSQSNLVCRLLLEKKKKKKQLQKILPSLYKYKTYLPKTYHSPSNLSTYPPPRLLSLVTCITSPPLSHINLI